MRKISEHNQFRKDLILKELEIISSQIRNYDKHSLIIKGWAITLWAVIWIWIIQNQIIGAILFGLLCVVPFWAIDALYKYYQTTFMNREEIIAGYLNDKLEPYLKGEDPSLILFDPTNSQNRYYKGRYHLTRYFFLRQVCTLYLALLGISFIGTGYSFLSDNIYVARLLFMIGVIFLGLMVFFLAFGYHQTLEKFKSEKGKKIKLHKNIFNRLAEFQKREKYKDFNVLILKLLDNFNDKQRESN